MCDLVLLGVNKNKEEKEVLNILNKGLNPKLQRLYENSEIVSQKLINFNFYNCGWCNCGTKIGCISGSGFTTYKEFFDDKLKTQQALEGTRPANRNYAR